VTYIAEMRRRLARSLLGFLTLAMIGPACGSGQLMSFAGPDGTNVCALPFEIGPCNALIPVYAYVGGACVQETYGGCEGNENRFSTLAECLETCAGQPAGGLGCPSGQVLGKTCLACGPAGGCSKSALRCGVPCDTDSICPAAHPYCLAGICQDNLCF